MDCAVGSLSAKPISTPTSRVLSRCSARATKGHTAAALPSNVMNFRRLIGSPSNRGPRPYHVQQHKRCALQQKAATDWQPWATCRLMQCNEILPHSITSSARASSIGVTVSPSVLAVCRLMTSSNLVGGCTGRRPTVTSTLMTALLRLRIATHRPCPEPAPECRQIGSAADGVRSRGQSAPNAARLCC
jgi:hypothetical protein